MSVVISPATTTRPVVISVSQATRPCGSSARTASSTESEIWSAILSGCPSVTDSDVKVNERAGMRARLAAVDLEDGGVGPLVRPLRSVPDQRPDIGQIGGELHSCKREQRQGRL